MELLKSAISVFVMALAVVCVNGQEHCSKHNFGQSINTTHLQYTKEAVNHEYAVLDQFKSLHCCAKGYRSIEWFKDGKPYPFPGLILYPDEMNQTIYTGKATMDVAGNYTCVLRNDTHKMEHKIELIVKSNPPETPLPTYVPQNLENLNVGDTARFYCEAFVGNLDLPDQKSEISWYKVKPNGEMRRLGVEIVQREDQHLLGAILTVPNLTQDDYGEYLCRIEMANPGHRQELRASLLMSPTVAEPEQPSQWVLTVIAVVTALCAVLVLCACITKFNNNKKRNKCQQFDNETSSMEIPIQRYHNQV